jgi:hypothetical protein
MDLIVLGVGALLISLVVVVFKHAAKHKKLNSPSNDIKLQRLNVMQLGPFSGHSNFYNRKKLNVFISLALFSLPAFAEDIKTLHNWNIQDFGDESLIVFKERNDSDQDTRFGFFVESPLCMSADPFIAIVLKANSGYESGKEVTANIYIDNKKARQEQITLPTIIETSDGMKISFIEFKYIPDLTEANSVSIRFNKRYFRKSYEFDTQGITYAMEKSEKICNMAQEIINTRNRI